LDRLPAFHKLGEKPSGTKQLGKYGKDFVHAGSRWGSDGLRSGGMGRLAYLTGDHDISTDDLGRGDSQVLKGLTSREIEHPVEGHLVAVQHSREKALDTDHEPLTPVVEFGGSAGSGGAQIQDRVAVRWVEAATVDACTLAAQGVVPIRRHLAKRLTYVGDVGRSGDSVGSDLHLRP
jgi:hypothetical protein